MGTRMEQAVERVDGIIERSGECILGGIMEQVLRCDTESLVNELKARGYVVRGRARDGYVVHPRRKRHAGPWMVIEVV